MPGSYFKNPKQPLSEEFDDFYFSLENGLAESSYVYLEGAGVLDALQKNTVRTPCLTVAEIGFGLGINFLLTLRAFQNSRLSGQTIEYWSFEKFPVPKHALKEVYLAHPEIEELGLLLLESYPLLVPGVHRLDFFGGSVRLNLVIGDAREALSVLNFKAQHWYWDGFSPRKNPDAFSTELFQEVAKHSEVGARGASYTSAGWVRRALEACGFEVSKKKGFHTKRESIVADLKLPAETPLIPAWFSGSRLKTLAQGDKIAVIGAGLGGSAIARRLADLGHPVQVFDPNGIAGRASSNSAALFNVQLSKIPNPLSRFARAAFAEFKQELKFSRIPVKLGILRNQNGALTDLQALNYPVDFYRAENEGVYLPECGMLNPKHLCQDRLKHPGIAFFPWALKSSVSQGDKIRLFFDGAQRDFDHVVYAIGADGVLGENSFENSELQSLPVRPVRGQTVTVRASERSKDLSFVRVDEGYACPVDSQITGHSGHLLGATYQAKPVPENQVQLDQTLLVEEARSKWPEFSKLVETEVMSTKVGYRASTPDKMPLIGPLCEREFIVRHYAKVLRGSKNSNLPALEPCPGEWVLMGLGSRGVTFSSLAARILSEMMEGRALSIETDLLAQIHPARFILRSLRKGSS